MCVTVKNVCVWACVLLLFYGMQATAAHQKYFFLLRRRVYEQIIEDLMMAKRASLLCVCVCVCEIFSVSSSSPKKKKAARVILIYFPLMFSTRKIHTHTQTPNTTNFPPKLLPPLSSPHQSMQSYFAPSMQRDFVL